jgi:mannose/cellobiose epimerase-like protein (N-acyl-D-glucosamine 2-epimerase family)
VSAAVEPERNREGGMTGIQVSPAAVGRRDIVETLRTLMTDHSLPLWAREGWDSSRGGFVERLDPEGKADCLAPRRVRVQARQIYSFAKAAQLGWYPQGQEIAMKGLDYLLSKAKSPDGRAGFVHLLDPDGKILNPLRDAYDHAFVLLALTTVYELSGDGRVREEMDSLVAFLDAGLRSPHGGFIEGIPATLPRRQNPQMHLFEAMIAAYDATHDVAYQNRAGDLFGLFIASLYDAKREVLGEYFEEDWSRIEPVIVEPGHQAEWVWLLKGFERITGCPTGRHRAQLLSSALRFRDDATGCLIDEGDAEGKIRKSTRRLWPQTEIAKAWIAQAEAGEQGAADQALEALARLHRHYLTHPVPGGWYDRFDRDNRSLVEPIPASSFYHIICAIAEAERVLTASPA